MKNFIKKVMKVMINILYRHLLGIDTNPEVNANSFIKQYVKKTDTQVDDAILGFLVYILKNETKNMHCYFPICNFSYRKFRSILLLSQL